MHSLKMCFQKEKYLSVIKDTNIRKCFLSFRNSSHKLEIERGWYTKKKSLLRKECLRYVTLELLKMRNTPFSIVSYVHVALFVKLFLLM